MNIREKALEYHKKNEGKLAVLCKTELSTKEDLTLAYSPGVAEPCLEIKKDYNTIYDYTSKGNFVAVVTNGTAVLGLGDLGADASLPVMEGKAVLFKKFGGVDAIPICIDTNDVDKIVETVSMIQSSFGGINLEDIKAPQCFEVEERLKAKSHIPVFHDDQHGTAVVSLACLINALKIVKKDFSNIKVVINGSGSAGIAIAKLLLAAEVKDMILCDTKGAIYVDSPNCNNIYKAEIAQVTNLKKEKGLLKDVIKDADVFIGVSAAGCVTKEMVKSMKKDPIILALANPTPEIMPEDAIEAGAKIVCTGRSDMENQVNNVLAFPGIFRGALDVRAKEINYEMKIAASYAIANIIKDDELTPQYVIPDPFDDRIAPTVAKYVAEAAIKSNVAQRKDITPDMVYEHTVELLK